MKPYLASLAIGLLVGVIYALFDVRSPAPPVIALVGLLGILMGEQIPPLVRQAFQAQKATSWMQDQVQPHMFGRLPECKEEVRAARLGSKHKTTEESRHG